MLSPFNVCIVSIIQPIAERSYDILAFQLIKKSRCAILFQVGNATVPSAQIVYKVVKVIRVHSRIPEQPRKLYYYFFPVQIKNILNL